MQKRKTISEKLFQFFQNIAAKEVALFANCQNPIFFKPFMAAQGIFVLLLSFLLANLFIVTPHKYSPNLAIKSAITKQVSVAVVGGSPVEWTALVKTSDVKTGENGQYFIKLPKFAKNIKVSKISAEQAKNILQAPPINQLAKKTFFDKLLYLFADLGTAVDDTVQTVAPAPDATAVDLSAQAPDQPASTPGASATDVASPSDQTGINFPDTSTTDTINADNVVKVDYQTPAPQIIEQTTNTGKQVTVSDPAETPDQQPVTDVLAFTTIPKIYKVGEESKIHIKWKNNNNQEVTFTAKDTDGDNYLDYVEWTVPHLSDQVFDIIFTSKAFQLDSNQNIEADIYDQVKAKDNTWISITDGQYIRATFNQVLDNTKDNTVYAKPTDSTQLATIEVYPVYTDQNGNQTEGPIVATFPTIDHEDTYRVLLTNLQTPTDVFDLKVQGNVDVDLVVDPTNQPPNAPVLQQPADGSFVSTAGLIALWSDPNVSDTGQTNYRVAISAANCLAGTVVASGYRVAVLTNPEATEWTAPSNLEDRTYYWCAQNQDNSLATSAWTSMGSFILDNTPPTVYAGADKSEGGSFSTSDATASDSGSGIAFYSWSEISGPGTISFDSRDLLLTNITADTDGTYVIDLYVEDNVGNGTDSQFTLNWAATAPTTSDDYTHDGVWVNSAQTITLTPNCGAVGCLWTNYCLTADCDPATGTPYTSPVTISTDGLTHFRYASKANAGNVQTTQEKGVKIDTANPTADVVLTPLSYSGNWTNQPVGVAISCTDSDSGCENVYTCISSSSCDPKADLASSPTKNLTFNSPSDKTLYWAAKDNVGNWSDVGFLPIKINAQGPSIVTTPSYAGDWINQAVSVSIACPGGGGCANVYACTGNSCDPKNDPSPSATQNFTFSSNTNTTLYWIVQDGSGNWTSSGSLPIKIDLNSPTSTGNSHLYSVNGWISTDATINLSTSDPTQCSDTGGSGCHLVYFCWVAAGSSCNPTTDPNPGASITRSYSTAAGTTTAVTAEWKYRDNAGNWSQLYSQTIGIDKTAPTNSIASVNVVSNSEIDVNATTSTDGSGSGLPSKPYQFKVDSTELGWQSTTSIQSTGLSPNTQHSFSMETRDLVGNTSGYSSIVQKYTLANPPTGLALSATQTQVSASWLANSNSDGTQYYIEDANTPVNNSSWTTVNSWAFLGLTCNTTYNFHVKAENGDRVATDYSGTATIQTSACPIALAGTGGGNSNLNSAGGLVLLINGGMLTTISPNVNLTLRGPASAVKMMISEDLNFRDAFQQPYKTNQSFTLSDGNGQKTIYVKFLDTTGQASQVVSQSIKLKASTSIPDRIDTLTQNAQDTYQNTLNGIAGQIKSIQDLLNATPSVGEKIEYPPIENSVPKQPQLAFQSPWAQVLAEPISNFANNPLPREFSDMVVKFPQLDQTLKTLGINGVSDIPKIKSAQLILPTLTETTIPRANLTNVSQNNTPLTDLTPQEKQNIPSEVIFARSGEGLLDLNTVLTIDQNNQLQQRMNAISGQNLELVVKPKATPDSIIGYVVYKSKLNQTARDNSAKIKDPYMAALSLAIADLDSQNAPQQNIVLNEFQYTDPNDDGIYTADIQAPLIGGNYQISTVINYKEKSLAPITLNMVTVVDPEGYVFANTAAGEVRISGAVVSLYWLNPTTQKYELWPAKNYRQENPQITDTTGIYSFLVPPGKYYISISSNLYSSYKSASFNVDNRNSVNVNIGLTRKFFWSDLVSWQSIAILLLLILIGSTLFKNKLIKLPSLWQPQKSPQ